MSRELPRPGRPARERFRNEGFELPLPLEPDRFRTACAGRRSGPADAHLLIHLDGNNTTLNSRRKPAAAPNWPDDRRIDWSTCRAIERASMLERFHGRRSVRDAPSRRRSLVSSSVHASGRVSERSSLTSSGRSNTAGRPVRRQEAIRRGNIIPAEIPHRHRRSGDASRSARMWSLGVSEHQTCAAVRPLPNDPETEIPPSCRSGIFVIPHRAMTAESHRPTGPGSRAGDIAPSSAGSVRRRRWSHQCPRRQPTGGIWVTRRRSTPSMSPVTITPQRNNHSRLEAIEFRAPRRPIRDYQRGFIGFVLRATLPICTAGTPRHRGDPQQPTVMYRFRLS